MVFYPVNIKNSIVRLKKLMEYSWPGNVRELFNIIEAGSLLCSGEILKPENLQLEYGLATGDRDGYSLSLDQSEKQTIIRALEKAGWVQKHAADILGISRRAIHYKIRKHNIEIHKKEK